MFTPASCYHIASLTVDGASVPVASTYTFTNVNDDHTISATFGVNVLAVTCPSGSPFNLDANASCQYVISGSEVDASVSGACGSVTLTYSLSGATVKASNKSNISLAGIALNKGKTTVTWTAQDDSKHKVSCSFIVSVSDNQAPAITCKPDDTRYVSSSTAVYKVSGTEFNATATDNCGVTSLIYSLSGATVASYSNSNTSLANKKLNKGTTVITWKATDAAGNTSTCTTSVVVTSSAAITQSFTGNVSPSYSAKNVSTSRDKNFAVKVSPNPSATNFRLQVESPSNEFIDIRVLDISGRVLKVITKAYKNQGITVGDGYIGGTYFAEVIQGKNHAIVKLIKLN